MAIVLVVVASFMLQTTVGKERFRPYEILEIKRGATQQEVKKAYRRLVKDHHPDKNKAPDAQDKFVKLTKAYELLSDPERRRMYDNHGVTEDSPNFNKKHDYSQYNRLISYGVTPHIPGVPQKSLPFLNQFNSGP